MNGKKSKPLTQVCPNCLGAGRTEIPTRLALVHQQLSIQGPSTATVLHASNKFKVGVTAINNYLEQLRKAGLARRWQSGSCQWTYEALRNV